MSFPSPICSLCELPLDQLGAIILSPPPAGALRESRVIKHHCCVPCWDGAIVPLLAQGRRRAVSPLTPLPPL